jgi:hypothetical protein
LLKNSPNLATLTQTFNSHNLMQGVQLTDDLGHPDNDGSPAGAEGHAGGSFITLFTFVTAIVAVR